MAYSEEVPDFPEIWEVENNPNENNPDNGSSDGEIIDIPEPVERPIT